MLVSELLQLLPGSRIVGDDCCEFLSLCYDSRLAVPGSLFFALTGEKTDGHLHIADAFKRGAVAAIVEKFPPPFTPGTFIQVEDSRKAMAQISVHFHGNPSTRLKVISVTGTNGKTSCALMVASIMEAAGLKCGIIGTLGVRIDGTWESLIHTTPQSADLQKYLAQMADSGHQAVAIEASSHALALGRMDGVQIDTAIFTNLTQDHLDFHKDMETYFQAKSLLFTRYAEQSSKRPFNSVINIDDKWGRTRFLQIAHGRVTTYGIKEDSDLRGAEVSLGAEGVSYVLVYRAKRIPVQMKIAGHFAIYNSLAAAGAALSMGVQMEDVKAGLEALEGVPGRFESVKRGQPFSVVVDYAHTPDSLENILVNARKQTKGKLISVFGCGGDRDRTKRPLMGTISACYADYTIITSDNPRSEEAAAIADDIMSGVAVRDRQSVMVELDRRLAIRKACEMAGEGDMIVIAGKGHETYQIFGEEVRRFDDRETAAEELDRILKGAQVQ